MKRIHIIIIGIIVLGVALLVSASGDITTYASFKTALQNDGKVKVVGALVKDQEIYYNPEKDANYFSFYLEDMEGLQQQVVYSKPKPQDFEMSEQVVVTGKMRDDIFVASEILTKCPSKYKDEELALRQNG